MSRDLPWMKFDPVRFSNEPKLRKCCRQARSLYVDMLSLMHHARPYGHVLIDGVVQTPADIAAIFGDAESDVTAWLDQLVSNGVLQRNEAGALYCSRMVRDWAKAEADRANGAKGGNPYIATPSETQQAAMRDAMRREKDAERKRHKRAAQRSGPQTCPRADRNMSADAADSPRGLSADEPPKNSSGTTNVRGLTPRSTLEKRLLDKNFISSDEAPSAAVTPLAAESGGVPAVERSRAKIREAFEQRPLNLVSVIAGGEASPTAAIPPGKEFALGALAAGADAKRAVSIGIMFDVGSGGDIDVVTLEEARAVAKRAKATLGRLPHGIVT